MASLARIGNALPTMILRSPLHGPTAGRYAIIECSGREAVDATPSPSPTRPNARLAVMARANGRVSDAAIASAVSHGRVGVRVELEPRS